MNLGLGGSEKLKFPVVRNNQRKLHLLLLRIFLEFSRSLCILVLSNWSESH